MNVIQGIGVENSDQARALLAASGLCGCRIYGGRVVHIRHVHAQRSLCGKVVRTGSNSGWLFSEDCCRECARLALAVADD